VGDGLIRPNAADRNEEGEDMGRSNLLRKRSRPLGW
jgi:hypothetical protein